MPRKQFHPHPYQQECIDTSLGWIAAGRRRHILELPTGGGKTLVAGALMSASRTVAQKRPLLMIVPALDLVEQTRKKFTRFFFSEFDVGVLQGERNLIGRPVMIASLDSLSKPNRLAALRRSVGNVPFGLIIADECHVEILGEAYDRVLSALMDDQTALVGLSATPYRGDKRSLLRVFPDDVAYSIDWLDLVIAGYLADVASYDVDTQLDLSNVENLGELLDKRGELPDRVTRQFESAYHYQKIYEMWKHVAAGKRTIVYAGSVKAAYGWKDFLEDQGHTGQVETITAKTKEREPLYQRLREGTITFLTNCRVMRMGLDIPQIECIIIDCPMNRGDFTQTLGRGLRLWERKDTLIFINASDRHHVLATVGKLTGIYAGVIPSVRHAMKEQIEKEAAAAAGEEAAIEGGEEMAAPESVKKEGKASLLLQLHQVRARSRDLFVASGWTVHPASGLLTKAAAGGARIEVEPVGALYQASYVSPGGRHELLSPRPVEARLAKRFGELRLRARASDVRQREAPLGSIPEHREIISQEHWRYLKSRQIHPLPTTYEDARAVHMRELHFQRIDRILRDPQMALERKQGRLVVGFYAEVGDVQIKRTGRR